MSATTNIEWTEKTWNPGLGCDKVSPGCGNCYAIPIAHRMASNPHPSIRDAYKGLTVLDSRGHPQWSGEVRFLPDRLAEPLSWRKPSLIFVNSMSDLFHESMTDEQIAAIFGVMAACPQHTFQVLTKRPERAVKWFEWARRRADDGLSIWPDDRFDWRMGQFIAWSLMQTAGVDGQRPARKGGRDFDPRRLPWPLPNVWLGVSAEDQRRWDERISLLLQCPAEVHWVSVEPMLSRIFLGRTVGSAGRVGWIVVGGESGIGYREMDHDWALDIRHQCATHGIPFFMKQMAGKRPIPAELMRRQYPEVVG